MATVDAAEEPPEAVFDHPPSKRRYQVTRKGDRPWHRELLLTGGPQEVLLCEYPVKYVVGSGRHSRSYLAEVDGFLVESPVTWYTARRAWGMSPGYDIARQPGFLRAADESCLSCHAGRAEAVGGSLHRMHVAEPAIGCERCHGPGSLHVERHAGRQRPAGAAVDIDTTIVNPARLRRDLAEAVCQQCHLQPDLMAVARGRSLSDFRPGLPLQDFRHHYGFETADKGMMVIGHVEQLHLSRCYLASDTLSCLTCHDPHAEPRPQERTAYYRSVCLGCHRPERCTVPAPRRQQERPDNDCVHCHMPRSPTEIPHLAFTHHRIGVHDPPAEAGAAAAPARQPSRGELRPLQDLSRLSDIDRARSLGLAYLGAASREEDATWRGRYEARAWDLLSGARATGLRDAVLDAALTRLSHEMKKGGLLEYAQSALADPDLSGPYRCEALSLLANEQADLGRHEDAVAALRELTRLRRHPDDWRRLANSEKALGHPVAADEALLTAVRINPRAWRTHRYLADYYRRRGDLERAAWHELRAMP
jgi:predicted CXXCH cytochrome family protein